MKKYNMSYPHSTKALYKKLKRYQLPRSDFGHARVNSFWQVSETELSEVEAEMKIKIPSELRDFYLNVGYGNLVVDKTGRWSDVYRNRIVEPSRLPKLWNKTDLDFNIDIDLVADDELAFFDTGNQCFNVVRPLSDNPNAVYNPGDKVPITESLNQFFLRLYENTTFYLDHVGVYE